MQNNIELNYWLKDAGHFLERMRSLKKDDYSGITQNAQMVIESCAKAIISCFAAIEWTHDPAEQLLGVIEVHKDKIVQRLGEKMLQNLKTFAEDVEIAAPWHGKSIYGDWERRIPAVELCTEEVARDLAARAEHSFTTAQKFFNGWFSIK